jgi:hypothetical protein
MRESTESAAKQFGVSEFFPKDLFRLVTLDRVDPANALSHLPLCGSDAYGMLVSKGMLTFNSISRGDRLRIAASDQRLTPHLNTPGLHPSTADWGEL